jgi:hypothetical protein
MYHTCEHTPHTHTKYVHRHYTHRHTHGRDGARSGRNLEIDHSDDLAILYRRQAHACMH